MPSQLGYVPPWGWVYIGLLQVGSLRQSSGYQNRYCMVCCQGSLRPVAKSPMAIIAVIWRQKSRNGDICGDRSWISELFKACLAFPKRVHFSRGGGGRQKHFRYNISLNLV